MQSLTAELAYKGLKKQDIAPLQETFGRNEIRVDQDGSTWHMIRGIVTEPMFIMLLAACFLYFILGEFREGCLMLAAMIFVGAISFFQEVKSSNALNALRQYTQPRAKVIRDGKEQLILSVDLLPGDLLILSEGDLIPADADIVHANDLTINESIITGESLPVDKNAMDGNNRLFQGTTVNRGTCYAIVTATGKNSVLGELGKTLSTAQPPKTLLQIQISRFVMFMAIGGIFTFCIIWMLNYRHTGDMAQSLLLGLTLAMSILPQEIPIAFSSFMALGAYRMTKLGIITRQPLVIENLGAVSVICLDKTGTITENRMEVKSIYNVETDNLEEIKKRDDRIEETSVLEYARLASEDKPFDAMEQAIVAAYERSIGSSATAFRMIHEYPLGGHPPMMTHVYANGNKTIVAGKGAPERILAVCQPDAVTTARVQAIVRQMAARGYRVLGVCAATFKGKQYPSRQDDFKWRLKGLLALYDPPKVGVKREFDTWRKAGISIKLVTGDFKETTRNIAMQVGLPITGDIISGEELMNMTEAQQQQVAMESTIFARMFPKARLALIEALKTQGGLVAMIGDGVNDRPAIRSADVGIAMGGKGTEVAREAASLILTDDKLDKVSEAIRQGRKIYNNLRKAIRYILSIHVPIILTASLPLLLNWKYPNIFTPIHVIFLELIMGPTCSVFFENEPAEAGLMTKPPRHRTNSIFTAKELLFSVLQGLAITAGILGLYYYFMTNDYPIAYVRTVVFTTLILANIFLALSDRSFEKNIQKTILYRNDLAKYVVIISLIFLGMITFIPFIRELFHLTLLSKEHYLLCLIVSLIVTWWFEVYKTLRFAR